MKRRLIFFMLIIFTGCVERQVFENRTAGYKLILKKDSTYFLKHSTFWGKPRERGTYKVANDSILLKHITDSPRDGVTEITYSYGRQNSPDTVEFVFRDLNDCGICVNFTINNDASVFKTDNLGHLKLLYRDLVSNKIVSNDSTLHSLIVSYKNKSYFVELSSSYGLPVMLEIKLNQFVGEKKAIWYAEYAYTPERIIIKTENWKGIPEDIWLTRKR